MKKLLLASLAVLAMGAQAGSTTTNFNVTASVTPSCVAGVAPVSPAVAFGAYPAFSSSVISSTSGFTASVDCTRGLTGGAVPVASFDAAPGTALATGEGIVAGLNYQLAVATTVAAGMEPTALAGAPLTGTHNGTATKYSFAVSGLMAAGQAGNAAPADSGTQARVLTITF